jgi:hypothetical protein
MALQIDINNTTFLSNLLNKGIKSFGIENIIANINKFYKHYNLPFVSIGSGIGTIEYLANIEFYRKYNKNIEWICIDKYEPINYPPNAKYYIHEPLMKIDYLTTDSLIENNPSIIDNCILFLNWCEPNQSNYDYEAIIKLKPKAILALYEVFDGNGSAGGIEFYNWTINSSSEYNLKEMFKLYPYNKAHNDYVMDIRIGWWQHSNIFCDEDTIIIYLESKIVHEKNCYIM